MAAPPRVCALLVCARVLEDRESRNTTLFGVFDRITFDDFPAELEFGVYFQLTGLNGEYRFEVQVLRPDLRTPLARFEIPAVYRSSDPKERYEIGLNASAWVWPEPGRYTLRLLYNGVIADETTVAVEGVP